MTPLLAAVLVVLFIVPADAQTSATGRVTGRATTTVVTGADGRFVIEAFVDASSSSTLSASLPGFQTTTRDGFRTRPGGTVNLGDIRLSVSCLTIVDFVATGLREEAARARTVAHLRIESVQPPREWTIDKQCYTGSEVTAVVVHDSRGRRPGTRIRFVPIKSPSAPPYLTGEEIVIALYQDRASRQYFSWGYGYRVGNGVVALNAPFDEFEEEIPVDVLFDRLKEAR